MNSATTNRIRTINKVQLAHLKKIEGLTTTSEVIQATEQTIEELQRLSHWSGRAWTEFFELDRAGNVDDIKEQSSDIIWNCFFG